MRVFVNIRLVKYGELAKSDEIAKIGDRLPPVGRQTVWLYTGQRPHPSPE